MKTGYIGNNQYRYRWFKSPLGFTKFLLDAFIDTRSGFVNMSESNINGNPSDEEINQFAIREVKRIECMN